MRNIFITIITAVGLCASAGMVVAQDAPAASADKPAVKRGDRAASRSNASEKMLERYKAAGCSDDQIAKIKSLVEEFSAKRKEAAGDSDKLKALSKERREAFNNILTPEQKKKFAEQRPNRADRPKVEKPADGEKVKSAKKEKKAE